MTLYLKQQHKQPGIGQTKKEKEKEMEKERERNQLKQGWLTIL